MRESLDLDHDPRTRQLDVDVLVRLRWLAVLGQTAAIVVAKWIFGLSLPAAASLGCVGALAVFNLALKLAPPPDRRLSDALAAMILGFDVVQLAVLLALTGGLNNPFSLLFLAPIMTAAVSLPPRRVFPLVAGTLACAAGLGVWNRPLPWVNGETLHLPFPYDVGLWAALAVGAVFIALYASSIAQESRALAAALATAELVLAREHHLSELDGLAAAAAHELGTPLATVALVANELARMPASSEGVAEDLKLIVREVERCRAILKRLSSPAAMAAGEFDSAPLSEWLEQIAAPHRLLGIAIDVEMTGAGAPPTVRRNPGALYGLRNLVENAVDFAVDRVVLRAVWSATRVCLEVHDDGAGFPGHVLRGFGRPYISDRVGDRRGVRGAAGGLGLGLFIAKTLLERSGGGLVIANAAPPAHGATARVEWSRSAFEPAAQTGPRVGPGGQKASGRNHRAEDAPA